MKKDTIIIILGIIIIVLLGYMILDDKDDENKIEYTKEYCLELARGADEKYNNCWSMGMYDLYGITDSIVCGDNSDIVRPANIEDICYSTGDRYKQELWVTENCLENFEGKSKVLADCLSKIS